MTKVQDTTAKLERLRAELHKGMDSIERGDCEVLHIEDVIKRARSRLQAPLKNNTV